MPNTDKVHFTKPERILARLLNEYRISFKTKVHIGKYEIDFLIGNLAVELDGHEQNIKKNEYLVNQGFVPWHFTNQEVYEGREEVIQKIHGNYKVLSNPGRCLSGDRQ